jgi:uncharacterized protein YkwD
VRERTGGAARLPLVAALVAVACTVPTTAAYAATTADGTATVVALVNQERAEAGCSPVTANSRVTTAAQKHAQDQADRQTMTHVGSDGSNAGERIERAGYDWRKYGENVAWGTTSPEQVMQMWMDSADHRRNILNCAFKHIGVGVVDGYWTQDFATPM